MCSITLLLSEGSHQFKSKYRMCNGSHDAPTMQSTFTQNILSI